MGILDILFHRGKSPCDPCKKKVEAIKEEQRHARARIERMTQELEEATMNGEERWFLRAEKTKEGNTNGTLPN